MLSLMFSHGMEFITWLLVNHQLTGIPCTGQPENYHFQNVSIQMNEQILAQLRSMSQAQSQLQRDNIELKETLRQMVSNIQLIRNIVCHFKIIDKHLCYVPTPYPVTSPYLLVGAFDG